MNTGSSDLREETTVDLTAVQEAADAALALADQYDPPIRKVVFEAALGYALRQQGNSGMDEISAPASGARNTLESLANDLQISVDGLERVVDVSDGEVALFGNVEGTSRAERANQASAAYLFLKEQLVGEREAHLEELKEVSHSQNPSALDSNFTRNLRNGGYLKEMAGQPGSRDKIYRLLPAGAEAAKNIVRDLVGES